MATGTGNLPNQGMSFSPFAILTAEEVNDLVENIEAVANGTGIGDGAITSDTLAQSAKPQFRQVRFTVSSTGTLDVQMPNDSSAFNPRAAIIRLAFTSTSNAIQAMGSVDGAGNQSVSATTANNNNQTGSLDSSSHCLLQIAVSGTIQNRASFSSWIDRGMRLDVDTASSSRDWVVLFFG